jgi:hypothetical protein
MEYKISESRLDLEIYVMGDMKYEFVNFLEECFKNNFYESISWGNFKRFQLVLSNESNWVNIYFIIVTESSYDVLINSFKIFEKKNFTLLFYNANDQKSEKNIDSLYDNLIFERNKLYEGILNEDNFNKNIKKIDEKSISNTIYEEVKKGMKFLADEEDQLIYKIGFYPNLMNKKSKMMKKNEQNVVYEIDNEIFLTSEEDKSTFYGLFSFLLKSHFEQFKLDKFKNDKNMKNFIDVMKINTKAKVNPETVKKDLPVSSFLRAVNFFIILYIVVCSYKYFFEISK